MTASKAVIAQARLAGKNPGTIANRMRRHHCSAKKACAMGDLRIKPNSPWAKAIKAGFSPTTIRYRMKINSCSADEAIAMGTPRGGPDCAKNKAVRAGFKPATILTRMRDNQCSADEAIAMGPLVPPHEAVRRALAVRERIDATMSWIKIQAAKIGVSENVAVRRATAGWSVEDIINTPMKNSFARACKAEGADKELIRSRMRRCGRTFEEAIAMGPAISAQESGRRSGISQLQKWPFAQACREAGVDKQLIRSRMRQGKSFEEAIAMGAPLSQSECVRRALARQKPRKRNRLGQWA